MAVRKVLTKVKRGIGGILVLLDIDERMLDKIKNMFWVSEWETKVPDIGSHCEVSRELLQEINPSISLPRIKTLSDYACLLDIGDTEYSIPEIVVALDKGILLFDVWSRDKKLTEEDMEKIGEFVANELKEISL